MAATKFRFETSFDNGAHAAANAAETAHVQAVEIAALNGEARGYTRGYDQAMSEISAQTATLLASLNTEMQVLYDTLDSVKRQVIADGAIVACATGSAIGGSLMEKLPQERIISLVEELMTDVAEAPRLVLRVQPDLLDSTRSAVEAIAQSHGFSGRLIFMGETSYSSGDVTIEWAHGGVTFSALEQQQRVQKSAQQFVDSVLGGGDIETIEKVDA
jgi:flagellar assembly protein FliH